MELLEKLKSGEPLNKSQYTALIENAAVLLPEAAQMAAEISRKYYGNGVFIRGLIEITNYCKNDCYYCGIRKSNRDVCRYRLGFEDIMAAAGRGYELGFRSFVLQGGEDAAFSGETLGRIVSGIKEQFPDTALTLSMGERSEQSYRYLFGCGADRYLLRHETINPGHYRRLHPENLTIEHRVKCLNTLKEIGYQVGCGVMIGSPYQTVENLAEDLCFMADFKPHMVGIGPFLPSSGTPFADRPAGDVTLTLFFIALTRLTLPRALIPATTALGTLSEGGRNRGILAGANVVMPNLTPSAEREKYSLYDNKLHTGLESAEGLAALQRSLDEIGYTIAYGKGEPYAGE